MNALASSMATAIRSSGLPLSDLGGLIFHLQGLLRSDGNRQFSTRELHVMCGVLVGTVRHLLKFLGETACAVPGSQNRKPIAW